MFFLIFLYVNEVDKVMFAFNSQTVHMPYKGLVMKTLVHYVGQSLNHSSINELQKHPFKVLPSVWMSMQ